MGRDERASFLVRIRWHALRYDGVQERLCLGLALARLARYSEALRLLSSQRTLRDIADCWNNLCQQGPIGKKAAAGLEDTRCEFLGDLYTEKGNLRVAVRWYTKALMWRNKKIRLDPSSSAEVRKEQARIHFELGDRLWRLGLWNQARHHLQRVLAITASTDQALEASYSLGVIYRTEGLYARAARYFERVGAIEELEDLRQAQALPTDPTREQLLGWPGPVSWVVGGPRYLRAHPEDWEIRIKLCYKWRALYRFKEALTEIQAVERLHGKNLLRTEDEKSGRNLMALLTAHKAYICKQQGRYRAAAAWFGRAATLEPEIADHWTGQGACEARRGQFAEAEGVLRQATRCTGGALEDAWYTLGLVLRSQERFNEAADCFNLALKLKPGNEVAELTLTDVRKAMDFLVSAE